NGGHARLLRNECAVGNHWVRLTLQGDGKRSNTSAIGARITLRSGDTTLTRDVLAARGYLSQNELPVTFGLGKHDKIDSITVRWPGRDGCEETFKDVPVDKPKTLVQGTGSAK